MSITNFEYIDNTDKFRKYLIPRAYEPGNREFVEMELSFDQDNNPTLKITKVILDQIPESWRPSKRFGSFNIYTRFMHQEREEDYNSSEVWP